MPKLFSAGKSEAATSPAEVQAQLVISPKAKARARWLLAKDLSRGDVRAVGEPLSYPSASARGQQGGDDAASFLVTR